MEKTFEQANDASADKLVELMTAAVSPAETPSEEKPAGEAPASGADEKPSSEEIGASPEGHDDAGRTEGKTATAEPEPEKKVAAPAAEDKDPEPQIESYEAFLSRINGSTPDQLSQEEVSIARDLSALRAQKAELDKFRNTAKESETKIGEYEKEKSRLALILAAQEEDAREDPTDYALEQRIARNRSKIEELERRISGETLSLIKTEQAVMKGQQALNGAIVELEERSQSVHSGLRRSKQATVDRERETRRLNGAWNEGLKRIFENDLKDHNLTPIEQKWIARGLGDELSAHFDKHGRVPEDLYEWAKAQKHVVDEVIENRSQSQRSLLQRKASDLPGKPKDNVVSAGRADKPSTFKEAMRDSERRFDRALGL